MRGMLEISDSLGGQLGRPFEEPSAVGTAAGTGSPGAFGCRETPRASA